MQMVKVDDKVFKEVENDIRDLINWVEVWNTEEEEGQGKKVEDEEAKQLIAKLRKIASKLGLGTL